jgi:hypothetical protein
MSREWLKAFSASSCLVLLVFYLLMWYHSSYGLKGMIAPCSFPWNVCNLKFDNGRAHLILRDTWIVVASTTLANNLDGEWKK